MAVAIPAFWKLIIESKLLALDQCKQLAGDFKQVKDVDQADTRALASWLVSRNVLSKYQTAVLLAGRAGPFFYGDYRVYDRVDKGRLSGCFRALHAATGQPVLLQFCTGAVTQDPRLWGMAANDVAIMSNLGSPFVQRVFEAVDLQRFRFIVSEDLRGSTADERMQQAPMPPIEACRIAISAALGLMQMHQFGRMHGDIRPGNVFVEAAPPNQPPLVKLLFDSHLPPAPLDFQRPEGQQRIAALADYLAPELLQPGRAPDPTSEVYALGCLLYTLLTGAPPFAGGDVQQKLARQVNEPPRPLDPNLVGPPLAQLVPYLLAKNPAMRFPTPAVVVEQLGPLVDPGLVYVPSSAPQVLPQFENWLRQKHTPAAPSQPAAAPPPAAAAAVAPPVEASPTFSLSGGPAGGSAPPPVPGSATRTVNVAAIADRKRKKQQQMLMFGAGGSLLALIVVGIVALMMSRGGPETELAGTNNPPTVVPAGPDGAGQGTPSGANANTVMAGGTTPPITPTSNNASNNTATSTSTGAVTPEKGAPPAVDPGFKQEVVADDGQLLWASPTTGQPVEFRLVPPDGRVFIVARPAALLKSSEGERVLNALGPAFAQQRAAIEQASGFKLEEIERMIVTLHSNGGEFPRVSSVITPVEKLKAEALVERWGSPTEVKEGEAKLYTGNGWAYYHPEAAGDATFVLGAEQDVRESAKAGNEAPKLFRDMERMRRSIDGDRQLSVLFAPGFLLSDEGAPLFSGERQKVREPISALLGDGVEATLFSMHCTSECYVELRALGSLDREENALAQQLRDRLKKTPTQLEDYFVSITPPSYWKKLAFRYPAMVGMLSENLRAGVENDQAVINTLLPGAAAHNLVLGGELLLASSPGATVAAAGPAAPASASLKTVEDVLALKTTLTFDAMAFDSVMAGLASDAQELAKGSPFGKGGAEQFTIKILGIPDLKEDGITQQQTVRDFKQEDKTIAEVLTAMVLKANPVTTVKSPTETDQKLLWVVGPDPDNPAKRIVLITTRTASAKKKYTLPAVFQQK